MCAAGAADLFGGFLMVLGAFRRARLAEKDFVGFFCGFAGGPFWAVSRESGSKCIGIVFVLISRLDFGKKCGFFGASYKDNDFLQFLSFYSSRFNVF